MILNEKLLKHTKYGKYIDARYKTLWTGTWNSGSITVNNASKYDSFLIYVDNTDPIPVYRTLSGTKLVGSVTLGTTANYNQYEKVFRCDISGNKLTWDFAKELPHNASGNHGTGSAKTVAKIIGLDPILNNL